MLTDFELYIIDRALGMVGEESAAGYQARETVEGFGLTVREAVAVIDSFKKRRRMPECSAVK